MKSKKITRTQLAQGMLMVTSDQKDATIYVLGRQHDETGFVWQAIRYVQGRMVSAGWIDYSIMRHPTKEQLAQHENVTMLKQYHSALGL